MNTFLVMLRVTIAIAVAGLIVSEFFYIINIDSDVTEEENECLNLPTCETYKCRANQIDSDSGTWHLQRKQNYLLEYQNCLLENGGLRE